MKSKLIKVKKTDFCSLSLIDNMGKVFFWKKNIYRAISAFSFTSVNNLFNSGLISFLEKKNLIPSSKFLNNKVVGYKAVIQHETAKVVSYPHEWSFEMLKKAAETILEVNKTAIKFGFQTNDCHSYNIVFFNGKPKFVDIGSFFRIPPIFKNYLFSYAEFCKCYLFPMLIWSVGDTHTARLYLQRWKNMTPPDAYIAYRLGGCKGLIRRFALKFWLLRERIQGVPHILSKIAPDQRIYRKRGIPEKNQPVKPVTYSVIKTGLIGLTRYLATYWAHRTVRVNALSPGGVFLKQPKAFTKKIQKLIPLGRMAQISEYKGAVQFLCSDASKYINGQNIIIDGGRSIW